MSWRDRKPILPHQRDLPDREWQHGAAPAKFEAVYGNCYPPIWQSGLGFGPSIREMIYATANSIAPQDHRAAAASQTTMPLSSCFSLGSKMRARDGGWGAARNRRDRPLSVRLSFSQVTELTRRNVNLHRSFLTNRTLPVLRELRHSRTPWPRALIAANQSHQSGRLAVWRKV